MKICFDFDGTLSEPTVQNFCRDLVAQGHEAWICTMRYSPADLAELEWEDYNDDLFRVATNCGISPEAVIFTGLEEKSKFLESHNFSFHLDDDAGVVAEINSHLPNLAVLYPSAKQAWREACLVRLIC